MSRAAKDLSRIVVLGRKHPRPCLTGDFRFDKFIFCRMPQAVTQPETERGRVVNRSAAVIVNFSTIGTREFQNPVGIMPGLRPPDRDFDLGDILDLAHDAFCVEWSHGSCRNASLHMPSRAHAFVARQASGTT